MTRIKICGLTRPEDIEAVNEAQPDYCGFIIEVPWSKRNVSADQLRSLRKGLSDQISPVGVFVNAPCELAAELLNDGSISAAQLHGQEDETYIAKLRKMTDRPIIKAFSVRGLNDIEAALASSADMILLDSGRGGTGETFDWGLLRRMEGRARPFFLAGGMDQRNIPEVIRKYRPWGIDLSSSVETDGKKDREKIIAAVAAVRSCRS